MEARAEILRRRFLDDLPDIQALVGVWGSSELVHLFDELDDYGPKISAAVSVALHLKVSGERLGPAIESSVNEFDRLLKLLERARTLVQSEQEPA